MIEEELLNINSIKPDRKDSSPLKSNAPQNLDLNYDIIRIKSKYDKSD